MADDPRRSEVLSSRARAPTHSAVVVPAVVLFFLLHTVPVLMGVFYSFTDYRGFGGWEFIGLGNYRSLAGDDRVRGSYLFTLQFALVTTVVVNVLALAVAVGLNARIRMRDTLRATFFLPNVLSVVIVGFVFNYVFTFLLPAAGRWAGIARLSANILSDPELAWLGVVCVAVWQGAAFAILLYFAGLQSVPEELVEAAKIDGAGAWRRFWRIVLPLLAPIVTINVVLAMKGSLQVFDVVLALTNGGPGTATESVSVVMYRGGLQGAELAYQSANAVVFLVLLGGVCAGQLVLLRRREVRL